MFKGTGVLGALCVTASAYARGSRGGRHCRDNREPRNSCLLLSRPAPRRHRTPFADGDKRKYLSEHYVYGYRVTYTHRICIIADRRLPVCVRTPGIFERSLFTRYTLTRASIL